MILVGNDLGRGLNEPGVTWECGADTARHNVAYPYNRDCPQLRAVVEAWPYLSQDVRNAIAVLLGAAHH